MARNVKFDIRRGAGSPLEVLYGKVSLTPTLKHTVSTATVLPAPTTYDLINGVAIATNVAPSPAAVDGKVEWAYVVKITDNYGKSWEYMVGVPDGVPEINFNVLPRYFETKPPLLGKGEQGVPGSAATIAVGNVTSGPTPSVTNTGTSTEAVLNFTLAKGGKGDKGEPGVSSEDWANAAANSAAAAEASKQAAIAASQLVDAPSDEVVRGLVASPTTLTYGSVRNAVRDVVSDVSPESTMDEAVKGLIETVGTQTQTALSAAIAQQVEDPHSLTSDSLDRSYVRTPVIRPNEWFGRVGKRSVVPTPDPVSADGEAVHPSVLYFPDGWNGYRYWMGFTPYAGGNDKYEDPCIAASHDGDTWEVPAGLTNPLDEQPGGVRYNSDTNLVFHDGKLYLFWRNFDNENTGKEESLWLTTSVDGSTWAPKVKIYESNKSVRRLVSPAFQFVDGLWHMWAVDLTPTIKTMVHLTATTPTGAWSTPELCNVPIKAGKMPWHLNVKRVGNQYVGLMNDTLQGGTGAKEGELYLIASWDGINFTSSEKSIIPRRGPHHDNLYEATFVASGGGFDVWYSARITGSPSVWSILRSRLHRRSPGDVYATASGTTRVGNVTAGGGVAEVAVVFPAGLFTEAPTITASPNNGRVNVGTSAITKDGFTLKGFNWTTGDATAPYLSWVATQANP